MAGDEERDLQVQTSDRLAMYALLARLWRSEVDEELFCALRDGPIAQTDEPFAEEELASMRAYLASPGACVLDLARDYAKSFCGAGSTKMDSAYPFESVYTSEGRMLMQDARDAALAWYHRFGLGKAESWYDCEDHLGLELEFMSYLVGCQADAARAGDGARAAEMLAAQEGFAGEHLVNWLPEFARDADRKARTPFYRGLAVLTSRYVEHDLAALRGAAGGAPFGLPIA